MSGKSGGQGGGFLEGLSTLVEKLSDLAEKGERLQKSGEFSSSGEKVKGAYGVDIRIGAGGAGEKESSPEVEPLEKGTERQRETATVLPIREPPVDVFDESSGLLVVAQLPGVSCKEIVLELREDILTLDAAHDDIRYHKEVLLPRRFSREQLQASCRNGVLEIRMAEGGAAHE